ncbi:MAG TPA: hypothetical protein VJ904_10765 [Tichowtungia sp.]|nr:hypothetical protein [Tichowtungia sp.]
MTLAVLLLAGSGFAGSDLFLDETFGLTEKIEVLAYKAEDQSVKVRTAAGISMRSFDAFPEVAQKEILAWVADEIFESSSDLRVRIDEKSKERDTENGEIEQVVYVVEMENRGGVAVENVRVQAVVFYEMHRDEHEQKRRAISSARINIPAGKKQIFTSSAVQIRDEIIKYEPRTNSNGNEVSRPSVYLEDELNGMVLVLTRVNRNGIAVIREMKDGRPPKPDDRSDYR